jgi:hypothetical protein
MAAFTAMPPPVIILQEPEPEPVYYQPAASSIKVMFTGGVKARFKSVPPRKQWSFKYESKLQEQIREEDELVTMGLL